MQTVNVRFYGKLSAAFGSQLKMPITTPCTVAALRRMLVGAHPQAAEALQDKRVRAIVGNTVVPDTHQLVPGDEVEFLAPVSGG